MTLPFPPCISRLEKRHNRGAFSCGKAKLDVYLQKQARQDLKKSLAAVVVLEGETETDIAGFYALSALSIDPGDLSEDHTKKLPTKRPIPCTLLGQFAIASKWQGQGVGEWLLIEMLERVHTQSKNIGSWALVVDAIDDDAIAYWLKYGFIQFPSTKNRLFLLMETISKVLTD